ncbi:MAG: hypothetical protein PHC94_10070 [Methylobacter sp.]|nr:hypothetical protein [Methylobacter sp.]
MKSSREEIVILTVTLTGRHLKQNNACGRVPETGAESRNALGNYLGGKDCFMVPSLTE